MQRKYWKISLILILVIALAILLSNKDQKTNPTPIVVRIGLSLPLTGGYADLGLAHREMIKLAIKEVEEKGSKYDYELFIEDDALDIKKTQLNLQKFININKIDIFTDLYSGGSNAVNATLKGKDIMLYAWTTDPEVAKARDLTFTYASDSAETLAVMVKELKKRNIDNVNIFMSKISFCLSQEPFIKEAFEKNNIKYHLYKFNPGEKDFRMAITKAKKNNAQLHLLQFYTPDLEIFAKQLKDMGDTTDISSIETIAYSPKKEVFEGTWFAGPATETDKKFLDEFTKITGLTDTNSSEYSYHGYKLLLEPKLVSYVFISKIFLAT